MILYSTLLYITLVVYIYSSSYDLYEYDIYIQYIV